MDSQTMEIFHNLQRIRDRKKLNQAEVAVAMGYELNSSLSHVEAGRKNISGQALISWLYALDIDLLKLTQVLTEIDLDFSLFEEALRKNININDILKEELEKHE